MTSRMLSADSTAATVTVIRFRTERDSRSLPEEARLEERVLLKLASVVAGVVLNRLDTNLIADLEGRVRLVNQCEQLWTLIPV
ncbi:hypothetical protein HAPAU_29140 [Halalkalicoccus paucihalophilus]|uniref:Uncharacterized protein n=1 Tax=Halalkalicoccus paucihalophilus TaxID=1008153 RepID=A0A151ABS3_9EURY|nr:hypothetical protein HAPAU_29140 [Halalkalicoccus paucihalophilus]